MTGYPLVDALIIAAAALTALGVIWGKFLLPIIRAAKKVNETLPVLVDIAEDFRPNGGGSLHDIIATLSDTTKKMAADSQTLSIYAHGAKHDTLDKLVVLQGWQDEHGQRLDEFIEETKARFEELGLEVTAVKSDLATVMTIIDRRQEPR